MKNDISAEIVLARKLLNKIESLNSNPAISGENKIFEALVDLDVIVQAMFVKMEEK